jgi:hypothetical protein
VGVTVRRTVRNTVVAVLAAASLLVPGGLAYAAPPASEPPTGLRATGATTSTVSLAWNPASGATSYQVLRGAPGGTLAVVGSTGSTTYTDSGRAAGTTYAYAVAAVRKTKVSAPSASITVTTVPLAPTGVTATALSSTSVLVGWGDSRGATAYDVYRATGQGAAAKVFTYPVPAGGGQVPAPSWTDSTVSPSTTYTYTVVARNASGSSPASAGATVTTPAPPPPPAKVTPTVTVTSSLNPARHGDRVDFMVRVSGPTGSPVPTGVLQVRLLGQTVDSVLDASGSATFDWVLGQDGNVVVTAAYQGDSRYETANGSLTQDVQPAPRLAAHQDFATGSWPESVVVADVNGDGRSEAVVVTTFYFDDANDYSLFVHDFVPGSAAPAVTRLPAGTSYTDSAAAAAGDVDGDGYGDVVVASDEGVRTFHGSPAGLTPGVLTETSGSVRDVVVGDVSGDGLDDVVMAVKGSTGSYAAVLVSAGDRTYVAEDRVSITHSENPVLALGDVTGDGVADVVAMWRSGRAVEVLTDFALPTGSGSWDTWAYQTLPGTQWPTAVAAGDTDGDGLTDVVVTAGGNRPDSRVTVLQRLAGGTLSAGYSLLSHDIPEPVAVTDLDGDSRADIVLAHGGWNEVGVYRQSNVGQLLDEQVFPVPYASHYHPRALAAGDVTGDGRPDVLLADYNNGLVLLRGY